MVSKDASNSCLKLFSSMSRMAASISERGMKGEVMVGNCQDAQSFTRVRCLWST